MSARRFEFSKRYTALSLFLGLAMLGCGGKPTVTGAIKKAPMSGKVTLKGKPLADAEVYFFTEKFTGFAKTNAEGEYILAQGAAIGKNKVFFSKMEGGSTQASGKDPVLELNDPGQADAANMAASGMGKKVQKQLIPPEYNSDKTTKLTFDVVEGGAKDADFNL